MQDRHVVGQARVGMPAEQVVVKGADLARAVVMADVVEVGLGQRSLDEAEDHEDDPQGTQTP
jgi:hypothetical protein